MLTLYCPHPHSDNKTQVPSCPLKYGHVKSSAVLSKDPHDKMEKERELVGEAWMVESLLWKDLKHKSDIIVKYLDSKVYSDPRT